MNRYLLMLSFASVLGVLPACAQPEPVTIKIEEGAATQQAAAASEQGDATAYEQGRPADEGMGAGTEEKSEMPEPEVNTVPVEQKVPETPKAPDTTSTQPANVPMFVWKAARDGGYDNSGAVVGTWAGERALICRTKNTSGAIVTGTLVPSSGACFFDNNGEGYYATAYEFMSVTAAGAQAIKWSFVRDYAIPAGAVATGTTNLGKPSYACRVDFTDGNSVAGHVAPGYEGCYYSVNADVYVATNFYVLVK